MKCINCPLYKFDGSKFSCAGIPYHDFGEEGMFADPRQPKYEKVCAYARVRLRALNDQIRNLEIRWKRVDDMIRCYRIALFNAPNVPEWTNELESRLREAYLMSSKLICEKLKCIKEKSTIASQLDNSKTL